MSKEVKPSPVTVKAGQNVFATIDGKEIGPVYCVQIADGVATLQAGEVITAPASSLRAAD